MQPKSHTDRLPFESSKQTTHQQLEEKASKQALGGREGRTQTRRQKAAVVSSEEHSTQSARSLPALIYTQAMLPILVND